MLQKVWAVLRVGVPVVLFVLVVRVGLGAMVMEPSTINHYASFCSTNWVVNELEAGANPNRGDRFSGWSPLFVAASAPNTGSPHECVNTMEALLEAGGDVNRREEDFSLLAVASAGEASPELIDLLVSRGADVCTPLSEHLPDRVRVGVRPDRYVLRDDLAALSQYTRERGRSDMAERLEHYEQACPAGQIRAVMRLGKFSHLSSVAAGSAFKNANIDSGGWLMPPESISAGGCQTDPSN